MRLFRLVRCGDPFNRRGWDVHEYERSFRERICIYRGDLSPHQGLRSTGSMLRRMYPGCVIKVAER